MAVGKEALRTIESLAERQVQIFSDACDTGVEATPETTRELKQALAELANLEGMRVEKTSRYTTVTTRLGFEMDEGKTHGVEVKVTKVHDPRNRKLARYKQFYMIDIRRKAWADRLN